jgi:hypothetical protein
MAAAAAVMATAMMMMAMKVTAMIIALTRGNTILLWILW